MKHLRKCKFLALLLVFCMCFTAVAPMSAEAAKGKAASQSTETKSKKNNKKNENNESSSSSSDVSSAVELVLEEDETTVVNGDMLRASTYGIATAAETGTAVSNIKYFPVTLFNYEEEKINSATYRKQAATGDLDFTKPITQQNGFYFTDGNPDWVVYECTAEEITVSRNESDLTKYTDGSYYYVHDGEYIPISGLTKTTNNNKGTTTWTITVGGVNWKQQYSPTGSSITLYRPTATEGTDKFVFLKVTGNGTYENCHAKYNFWTGNSGVFGSDMRKSVYSGLVDHELGANRLPVFTVPEGGVFTEDNSNKDVYTKVGLPFEYNNGTYTFDSASFGAYFEGAPASDTNLLYSTTEQKNSNGNADKDGWFPFNPTTAVGESADFHFGMAATISFTMTSNGKVGSLETSDDIVFNFSGDDDVWVFIDGHLVLDLGGIHDAVSGSLNFAKNTYEIKAATGAASGDANTDVNMPTSGKIFKEDGSAEASQINQTRETFAATESHELTVFYLERGKGESNCKIEFNLPMNDSVSVRKDVNKLTDSAGEKLAEGVAEQIVNRDFSFVLYKNDSPVSNASYSLLNANGQYVQTGVTSSTGHFSLKDGQTAKFIGEIASTGDSYYVVETVDPGWESPEYTSSAEAANSSTSVESSVTGGSKAVTAYGSTESADSVSFVCKNTMTHVDGTSLEANNDTIVIDYGLPVEIDVLANDVVVGGTKSIEAVTGAKFGTTEIVDGKIKYTLTKQLTDVEILTYTAKATATSGVESDNKTKEAKVYIIPATQMYYEENFSNLVSKAVASGGDPIESVGTPFNKCQEPGVVGTVDDSPYGSDVLYLNNTDDSNGTSTHFNLTKAANQFKYTFTGTGTTFFARTNKSSAYMRVVITDSKGNTVHSRYRDNKYLSERSIDKDATLYNIPVFTWMAENYGTYTVTVTLAKASTTYGNEFYLDGIRVFNPLDSLSENVTIAEEAYAIDNEANCVVETLREKLIAGNMDYDENTGEYVWAGINQDEHNFVLLTDNNDKIMYAQDYVSDGPKEEVYLYDNQKVSFKIQNWNPNTDRVYLGIKAPMGTGTVILNGQSRAINNTVDCYYTITDANVITEVDEVGNETKTAYIEVKAGTGCLISVTNVKVTGDASVGSIGPEESMDVQY